MLKKIAGLAIVTTAFLRGETAQADGSGWEHYRRGWGKVATEMYVPAEHLLEAMAIETRFWRGEIKSDTRVRQHIDNLNEATRLPFENGGAKQSKTWRYLMRKSAR